MKSSQDRPAEGTLALGTHSHARAFSSLSEPDGTEMAAIQDRGGHVERGLREGLQLGPKAGLRRASRGQAGTHHSSISVPRRGVPSGAGLLKRSFLGPPPPLLGGAGDLHFNKSPRRFRCTLNCEKHNLEIFFIHPINWYLPSVPSLDTTRLLSPEPEKRPALPRQILSFRVSQLQFHLVRGALSKMAATSRPSPPHPLL